MPTIQPKINTGQSAPERSGINPTGGSGLTAAVVVFEPGWRPAESPAVKGGRPAKGRGTQRRGATSAVAPRCPVRALRPPGSGIVHGSCGPRSRRPPESAARRSRPARRTCGLGPQAGATRSRHGFRVSADRAPRSGPSPSRRAERWRHHGLRAGYRNSLPSRVIMCTNTYGWGVSQPTGAGDRVSAAW